MRQRDIFISACELDDPAARASYLADACQGDAALQQEVEQLLQQRETLDSFLELPSTEPFASSVSMQVGSMIGPYKLRELLGEGGFGVVYVAEQELPVRRKVALKLIKPGMDSREVIARFEVERQALALMDHPNVARVLDAGTTDDDRPYFVMELVHGVPITEFADQQQLSLKERLHLFVDVCRALQHAHQKGLIHRDIKPTNVLVTVHDDKPVPKVIDFGVAKALHKSLDDKSIYTAIGQVIGTPMYMSPEQAESTGMDIDTRSDVYSLGVLLYELVTGMTPFEREDLHKNGYEAMLRMIRESEPLSPSEHVRTAKNELLLTISNHRKIESGRLPSFIRGELDWIVMKAMQKDRNLRYDSPAAFAEDVLRYLSNQPIQAGPPSRVYRLRKMLKRHRVIVGVGAIVAVGITTMVVMTLRQNRRVLAANALASSQLAEAEQARQEAKKVVDFILRVFEKPTRYEDGEDVLAVDLLSQAAAPLLRDSNDETLTTATFCETLGQTYLLLDKPDEAIELIEKALIVRRRMQAENSRPTLVAQYNLARGYYQSGRVDEALQLAERTLQDQLSEVGPLNTETLDTMELLGLWQVRDAHQRKGLDLITSAVEYREQIHGSTDIEVINSLGVLSHAYSEMGDLQAAESSMLSVISRIGESENTQLKRTKASMLGSLAGIQYNDQRYDSAMENASAAVSLLNEFSSEDDPILLVAQTELAGIMATVGDVAQAIELFQSTISKMEARLGSGHRHVLGAKANLVAFLSRAGRAQEAVEVGKQAYSAAEERFGRSHPITLENLVRLGRSYLNAGLYAEALESSQTAYERYSESDLNGSYLHLDAAHILIIVLVKADRSSDADQILRQVAPADFEKLDIRDQFLFGHIYADLIMGLSNKGHLDEALKNVAEYRNAIEMANSTQMNLRFAQCLGHLGFRFLEASRFDDAEPVLHESLEMREPIAPDDWATLKTASRLGIALAGQNKWDEAEPMLLQSISGMISQVDSVKSNEKEYLVQAIESLIDVYKSTGDAVAQESWQQELSKFQNATQ